MQPEPEFESEGTAELLGVETATKGNIGGGGSGGERTSHFGQGQLSFDGGAGEGGRGGDGGGGGSVPVVLRAGSYRVPAEAFLGPPERAATTWAGFQNAWSGLPYVAAFPVESSCHRPRSGTEAPAASEGGSVAHTASSIRLSMVSTSSGGWGGGGSRGGDSRAAAAVACPFGNTDYAVSTAWAFEAWDGTPVLCALTAMKAPFSLPPAAQAGGGGGEREPSWYGRFEVRCGSHACSEFAECNPTRLARFVTNGTFAPPVANPQQQQQQQQQQQRQQGDPFGGAFLPAASAAPASADSGALNGSHPDWFSRTDTAASPPGKAAGGILATAVGQVKPLVQTLWRDRRVDTVRRAPPTRQVGSGGTVEASA